MSSEAEVVYIQQEDLLSVALSEERVRTAQVLLQLRKVEAAQTSLALLTKYTQEGKYKIVNMDLEKGQLTRIPVLPDELEE